jgi:lipopolysaccharide transport protein LptA
LVLFRDVNSTLLRQNSWPGACSHACVELGKGAMQALLFRFVLSFGLLSMSFSARADLDDELPQLPQKLKNPLKVEESQQTTPSTPPKDAAPGLDSSTSPDLEKGKNKDPAQGSSGNAKAVKGKKSFSAFEANTPIEYFSLGLKGNRDKGFFELVKEVKVKQGDLDLFADAARVTLEENSDEIGQIVADGNVQVTKVDPQTGALMRGVAQKAIYYRLANRIEFKGQAKITRGSEILEGDSISYNLLTGDFEIMRPKGVLTDVEKVKN